MATISINGKFLAQPVTGVQRVARCLVQAIDRRLAAQSGELPESWELVVPAGAQAPALRAIAVRHAGPTAGSLHLWEQVVLPMATRTSLLLNLAGGAPASAARQVCVLHDAAVFDCADAYTPAFLAWYRWLFRRLARSPATIVTVSDFSRRRLAAALGVGGDRIEVVHNGGDHLEAASDDVAFITANGLAGKPYLLAVGNDNPNKNHAGIADAIVASGHGRDVALVIAGGGAGAVFAAARPADGLEVIRVGPVGDAQLSALYRRAIALVFASRYEGFGLPPLEAMSRGCPVVASAAAAVPEVCGDAAIYADVDRPAELAAAIGRIVADGALRDALRARGRARVAAFSWDRAAERLCDIVLRAAARTKTPAAMKAAA